MKIVTIVFIAIAVVRSLQADTYLRYKKTTDPYTAGGKEIPATTGESKAWIGKEAAAYDNGEGSLTIIHFKNRTMTVLDIADKQYSMMHLDSMGSMIDNAMKNAAETPEQAEAMKQMMQGMMGDMLKGAMKVTRNGEKKKIGSWNCERFDVSLSIMNSASQSEIWVTKDIKADPAWFNMLKNAVLAQMPGFGDIAKELKKVEGIPVKTVTRTQAMNTTITSTELLQESAEKKAPAGIYSIPKDFTKK
jgi:hypothetical protein